MIKEKSDALDKFKVFKLEVEKQLGKVIKIVRSNRGGEYYGRHGNVGQHMGPFAKYLQDCGIIAQYTMLGSPQQNGVAERRNRTLKDMMRSMMSRSNLPEYLWGEAIKTVNYVQLMLDSITHRKRNLILELYGVTSLGIQIILKATNSMILLMNRELLSLLRKNFWNLM